MRDQIIAHPDSVVSLLMLPRLIKLRDLPKNWWSVDTLYVLCENEENLERLIALGIERELWDDKNIQRYSQAQTWTALIGCNLPSSYRIFSIWSD